MDSFMVRNRAALLALAVVLPLAWCAAARGLAAHLTTASAALVLVLIVVAAAATGDRWAGIVAALSGAAWFDFFLTVPVHTFSIDDANDIEVAVLLVLVGVAVTEIALWGRRQQASSSVKAGYLAGVTSTSQIIASQLSATELVEHVRSTIIELLDLDDCHFMEGSTADADVAVLQPDGSVTLHDKGIRVERDGLPTMVETVLPVRHHGTELGRFVMISATQITRPVLESRQIAVLLANAVGADFASRQT